MESKDSILVIGLGEVGRPLLELLQEHYAAVGVDIEPVETGVSYDVMHVCYPFHGSKFIAETVSYIEKFQPKLTIINSTVSPGTTRAIHDTSGVSIVHSPVRGKHNIMRDELLHYTKFIGAINGSDATIAAKHFNAAGIRTKILSSPETSELAKLTETTYFAMMIAWAQEVERYCDSLKVNYNEVISIYEEIDFFPSVKYYSGVIGGHCVLPNIALLKSRFQSQLLEALEESNNLKSLRETGKQNAAPSVNRLGKHA